VYQSSRFHWAKSSRNVMVSKPKLAGVSDCIVRLCWLYGQASSQRLDHEHQSLDSIGLTCAPRGVNCQNEANS